MYDFKFYDDFGHEKETVRGLTYGQVCALELVCKRENIRYKVIAL